MGVPLGDRLVTVAHDFTERPRINTGTSCDRGEGMAKVVEREFLRQPRSIPNVVPCSLDGAVQLWGPPVRAGKTGSSGPASPLANALSFSAFRSVTMPGLSGTRRIPLAVFGTECVLSFVN